MLTSFLDPRKVQDEAIDRINSDLLWLIVMGKFVILTQRQKYEANLNINIGKSSITSTSYLLYY